jgi:hypothetical protein
MLFRETAAVCCKNHTEHTDALCGQNAEFILSRCMCVTIDGVWISEWIYWPLIRTYIHIHLYKYKYVNFSWGFHGAENEIVIFCFMIPSRLIGGYQGSEEHTASIFRADVETVVYSETLLYYLPD